MEEKRQDGASLVVDLLSLLERYVPNLSCTHPFTCMSLNPTPELRERYYKSLLVRLPYATAASVLFYSLWDRSYAKLLAIREINRGGLAGLYEMILETAGLEIRTALELIAAAGAGGQPLLFYCKLGKDRTGLLAALILHVCGASEAEIISDYARSDDIGDVALGGLEKDDEESLAELDLAAFSRAPPAVMEATLAYMQCASITNMGLIFDVA